MKPQLSFDPKMDNSYFQFVPLITVKPNSTNNLHPRIKQLQSEFEKYQKEHPKIEYSPEWNIPIIKVPHPYEQEITEFKVNWKEMIGEIQALDPRLPLSLEETDFEFIDKPEQVPNFLEEISSYRELAIDLEFHAYRSYQGFTWLMQLSTRNKDYIVDTICLRSHLQSLNKIFTDPNIVKVLHGSKSDIIWLQKDFGVYIVNLFDTGEASKVLGLKKYSLAYLLKHYCDVETDKKFQLADWRQRPLPEEMVQYARIDTHYLLYIYDKMRQELANPKNKDDNPIAFLNSVWKTSKDIWLQIYQKPKAKDTEYFTIISRNATFMGAGQMQVLDLLLTWRDFVARVEDESTKYVMTNPIMFDIARSSPENSAELEEVLSRHPHHTHHDLILKYEDDLLKRINDIKEKCAEIIQKKVAAQQKKVIANNHLESSSSSSDDEEESKVAKIKKQIKAVDKNDISIDVKDERYESKVFHWTKETAIVEKNSEKHENPGSINKLKLHKFEASEDLGELMGLNPKYVAKLKNEALLKNQEEYGTTPETYRIHQVSKQELKDAVVKVEEAKIEIAQEKEESDGEDNILLPPSITEKYNIKKKGKRSNKGKNKRQKTEEADELSNVQLNSQPTIMSKIVDLSKEVNMNASQEIEAAQKANKRERKNMIKSSLQEGDRLNPEKWEKALEVWDNVVTKTISKTKREGKRGYKNKPKSGKTKKKQQNRFDFFHKNN
jgi:ribonuclease D